MIFNKNNEGRLITAFLFRKFHSSYSGGADWLGYARPGRKCPNSVMV